MEILFFIILTAVVSSFIEYYRDKNKYFRARDESYAKKAKDFLYENKHRNLADALEKIKDDIYEDRSRGTEISVPREEYIEHLKGDKFKEIKMERLKLDDYRCQICFKQVDEITSHCHHITYLRVLNEKISDLSTLCYCCHKKLHEFHGKNKGHYPLISMEKLYW